MGKAATHGWSSGHLRVDETLGEIERASNSLQVKEIARYQISRQYEHVFDVDAWLSSISKIVAHSVPHVQNLGGGSGGDTRTIYRVPEDIRCRDAKAYEPRLVCIGCYHYVNRGSEALRAMQDYKWRCVHHLVTRRHGGGVKEPDGKAALDECLKMMMALDGEVRRCYAEEIQEGCHDLALMMVLDGCFLLDLFLRQKMQGEEEPEDDDGGDKLLISRQRIWNQVKYDVLLLENQIPFFVVQKLFDKLKTTNDDGKDLKELALGLLSEILPQGRHSRTLPCSVRNIHIHHLLHLVYLSIVPTPDASSPRTQQTLPEWIPGATELQATGVELKTRKNAASFLDITFYNGIMEIPPLEVHEYSNCLFRNLIAFEQCLPDPQYYVTAYCAFMDCIIHRPKDLRLLHQKEILVNRRGTDVEATHFFSRLCNQVHYAPDANYLRGVLMDVAKYREEKWHKWRNRWWRYICDYLNNPLAVFSIATGVFLLLMGTTQTFFAVYSYFLPPR